MSEKEEMRDLILTLLLCERVNMGDLSRVKVCAGIIAGRVHHAGNYEFANYVRLSPTPLAAIKREVAKHDLQGLCSFA